MSQGPKEIFAYEFHNRRHWNSRELECASWSGLEPVRYVRGDIADKYKALLEEVYENGCWKEDPMFPDYDVCIYCDIGSLVSHKHNCLWLKLCEALGRRD